LVDCFSAQRLRITAPFGASKNSHVLSHCPSTVCNSTSTLNHYRHTKSKPEGNASITEKAVVSLVLKLGIEHKLPGNRQYASFSHACESCVIDGKSLVSKIVCPRCRFRALMLETKKVRSATFKLQHTRLGCGTSKWVRTGGVERGLYVKKVHCLPRRPEYCVNFSMSTSPTHPKKYALSKFKILSRPLRRLV